MMSKHQKFMTVLCVLARDGISVTMDQRETGLYSILRLTRWPAPFAKNRQRSRISKIVCFSNKKEEKKKKRKKKHENIKEHEKSWCHKHCIAQAMSLPVLSIPTIKALTTLQEQTATKMKNMLRTVHALGKKGKPLSDFVLICE